MSHSEFRIKNSEPNWVSLSKLAVLLGVLPERVRASAKALVVLPAREEGGEAYYFADDAVAICRHVRQLHHAQPEVSHA